MPKTARSVSIRFLSCLLSAAPIAVAQTAGTEGPPANQNIPSAVRLSAPTGPGLVTIAPASPTTVGNCIPFGDNIGYGFTGFIYRNVPPFVLMPGGKVSFDLGALNDVDIRRNIYIATANINPTGATCTFNVGSQGVAALGWTKIVSDTQVPLNPRGNLIKDDYELTYTSEAAFNFPGGGLILGFGGSPPGAYADGGCDQVLVGTTCSDASGNFYSRFFYKADQTLGVLDNITAGGSGVYVGGVVIEVTVPVAIDIKFCSNPNAYNCGKQGKVPVTIFGDTFVDVSQIDIATLRLCRADAPAQCTGAPLAWSTADRGNPATDLGAASCAVVEGVEQHYLHKDGKPDLDVAFDATQISSLIGCAALAKRDASPSLVIVGNLLNGVPLRSTPVNNVGIDKLYIQN